MDKDTRNAIDRATQRARKLLEDDFAAQLEGTFDVLRDGSIAPKAGLHLAPRQLVQRDKIVVAIEHKRATGLEATEAVADYLRDAAFTTLNRFAALKMLEARELVRAMRGMLEVDSREGLGSRFNVRLPLAGAESIFEAVGQADEEYKIRTGDNVGRKVA